MQTETGSSEIGEGARAVAPVLLGLVPAGVAVGAAWSAQGLPTGPGLLASATVYGASAQLVVIDLEGRGAGVGLVAAMAMVASLRLAFLGVDLGRHLCGAAAPVRWLAALLLVGPAYLVADARFAHPSTRGQRQRYYLGAALTLWIGWQVAHAAGVVMGSAISEAGALDFALPLALLGLVAPRLRDPGAPTAALVAGAAAVLARSAPLGTGLLVATAAGITVAKRLGGSR